VKQDIREAAENAELGIVFGPRQTLVAKGFLGGVHEVSVYAVRAWPEFGAVQQQLVPNPSTSGEFFNLGFAQQRSGDIDAAIAAYRRAIMLDSEQYDAWNNLGVALLGTDRLADALNAFDAVVASGHADGTIWFNRGKTYQALGRYRDAIGEFERAAALEPKHAEAWNELAATYRRFGEYPQAADALLSALRHSPDFPASWYNLACTYALDGQHEAALLCLERAVERHPPYLRNAESDPELAAIQETEGFRRIAGPAGRCSVQETGVPDGGSLPNT